MAASSPQKARARHRGAVGDNVAVLASRARNVQAPPTTKGSGGEGRVQAHLVLLETSGNQDFIFSTNRLKENVGASELIHRIGTRFVPAAVAAVVPSLSDYAELAGGNLTTEEYARRLAEIAQRHPLGPDAAAEILVATSGKAVMLVASPEIGERIIESVTLSALERAPGAVVRGIVGEKPLDLADTRAAAHACMRALFKAIRKLDLRLPPPEARFPTLPIVAQCSTSALPAEHRDGEAYLSAPALAKQQESQTGWRRITASVGKQDRLAKHVDRLEEMGLPWLGVVHADGNGFGKVFLDLARHMPADAGGTARDYCSFYRRLSLALDVAGIRALRDALVVFDRKTVRLKRGDDEFMPIVPLVFGGDDLTVVCDGSRAVTFAQAYLDAFERATEDALPLLLDPSDPHGKRTKKFGGCAGVAIIKPHHPFHRAYDLAAELTGSAKRCKTLLGEDSISAVDFQVVYQDAARGLADLRGDWHREGMQLYARPYVVSGAGRLAGAGQARNMPWAKRHGIVLLSLAMRALRDLGEPDPGEERLRLPRSQQHVLRSALFEGRHVADARLGLVRNRYDKVDWRALCERRDSLFFADETERPRPGGRQDVETVERTRFLDALELIDVGEVLAAPEGADPVREAAE